LARRHPGWELAGTDGGSHVNLLALDTSTSWAALAIASAGGAYVSRPDPSARHGRVLIPAVRDLLAASGLSVRDLDGIAVGLGPGSYTGLRIGLTAAKTLAYAAGKPLVGLDSLEAVARNAPADALRIAVIGDAQRGDVYAADFVRVVEAAPLVRLAPTRIVALDRWAAELPGGAFVLGPALAVERLAAGVPGHARWPDDPDANRPDPLRLLDLACDVWASGRRDDPFFLEPVYLRRSAAEEQWERLGR
jgi:tRNA threonylcarbamoyladenosine biosynthesis protein TsaB